MIVFITVVLMTLIRLFKKKKMFNYEIHGFSFSTNKYIVCEFEIIIQKFYKIG